MDKTIQINQKLMEREDCLVDISHIERQINSILGQPYPFELPVDLPSLQKHKKPKRTAAPKAAAPLRLRKLDPDTETAYRITYTDNDIDKTEIHTEARPLTLLLNTPLPHITVHRIESIRNTDDAHWETAEILYESEETC